MVVAVRAGHTVGRMAAVSGLGMGHLAVVDARGRIVRFVGGGKVHPYPPVPDLDAVRLVVGHLGVFRALEVHEAESA